jgi:hypothetical protein
MLPATLTEIQLSLCCGRKSGVVVSASPLVELFRECDQVQFQISTRYDTRRMHRLALKTTRFPISASLFRSFYRYLRERGIVTLSKIVLTV